MSGLRSILSAIGRKRPVLAAAGLFFLLLLAVNHAVLSNPPYWDDIIGLHNQARWYVLNDFRVLKLWALQNDPTLVCPYPIGLMPLLYGVAYRLFTPVAVHTLGHLFNLGCVALALGLLYAMVARRRSALSGVLAALTALAEPVLAGRSAALGQECPLLLLIVASIYCFDRGRHRTALIWAAAAFLIKFTGIILILAYAVYWSWRTARRLLRRRGVRHLLPPLAATLAVLGMEYVLMRYFGGVGLNHATSDAPFFGRTVHHLVYLMPTLSLLLAAVAAAWLRGVLTGFPPRSAATATLACVYVGGFTVAYLIFELPLPRYMGAVTIPAVLTLFYSLPRRWGVAAGLVLIPLLLSNWQGSWCGDMAGSRRCGAFLERSREYLRDLEANRRLCRTLEEKASDHPVIAQWPFTYMLTVPEFGYVRHPLRQVYNASSINVYRSGLREYRDGLKLPADALIVYAENGAQDVFARFNLRPREGDGAIFYDRTLPGPLLVYIRGAGSAQRPGQRQRQIGGGGQTLR